MIIRDENIQVTENFNMKELYSNSFNAPAEHFLDDRVIQALQYIRSASGVPIRVTSTYRTLAHNTLIGGAKKSQHMVGKAIDFQFVNNNAQELKRLHTLMKDEDGPLRRALWDLGVRGFGYYQTFAHIDVRDRDRWVTWNDSSAMIDQDGVTAYLYDVSVPLLKRYRIPLATIGILGVGGYLYYKNKK